MLTGGGRAYGREVSSSIGLLFEQARPYRGAPGLSAKLLISLAQACQLKLPELTQYESCSTDQRRA